MSWNKNISVLVILFSTVLVYANEGAEKPAAADGHGGGAAATPAAAEVKYSGRQTEEWLKIQADVVTLKGKVETQKTLVEGLIKQRAHSAGHFSTEDAETLRKEHENLITMIDKYNAISTSFQNRFPEKGASMGRVYKRIDPENIDKMESQMTAEGRLDNLNKKIKKQYLKSAEVKVEKKTSAPQKSESLEHSGSGHVVIKKKKTDVVPVTEQIILQK